VASSSAVVLESWGLVLEAEVGGWEVEGGLEDCGGCQTVSAVLRQS